MLVPLAIQSPFFVSSAHFVCHTLEICEDFSAWINRSTGQQQSQHSEPVTGNSDITVHKWFDARFRGKKNSINNESTKQINIKRLNDNKLT